MGFTGVPASNDLREAGERKEQKVLQLWLLRPAQ
jgi:hypothetical protein